MSMRDDLRAIARGTEVPAGATLILAVLLLTRP
jgi:hypothetical protein